MSLIFIISFSVVGSMWSRDAEVLVRVNFLKHTKTYSHIHDVKAVNTLIPLTFSMTEA